MRTPARPLLTFTLAALVAAPLAGCGSDEAGDSSAEGAISVDDAWVRASDGPMTGSFGVITNGGDSDLTVVSAETSASDLTELHEVVMKDGEMVMTPVEGGFPVPAGGDHVLEPGADHVMIMNMAEPIMAGDDVEITLTFDDGSRYSYIAQAREAEVGDETYAPGEDGMMGEEGSMDDGGSES